MDKASYSVDACPRQAPKRGYCNRHYENLRLRGNPVPQRDRDLGDRLAEVGWTVTPRDCWEWNGKRNDHGYGIFNSKRLGLEDARAHRVMYEHFVGATPSGLMLRHSCDNPPCVNPEHLQPGSAAESMRDMVERRRHWRHDRTECDNGHDLTEPGATRTVHRTRGDETICVECARERSRRHERQRRAS